MAAHGDRRVGSGHLPTDPVPDPARQAPRDRRPRSLARSLIVTARPRQWAKNVLVFGAPAVGGVLLVPDRLLKAVLAFTAFCLASSGMYYVNDIVDRQVDRQHWRKQLRPLAAGQLGTRLAAAVAVLLVVGGLAVASWAGGWRLSWDTSCSHSPTPSGCGVSSCWTWLPWPGCSS